jgi:hypothetical protein
MGFCWGIFQLPGGFSIEVETNIIGQKIAKVNPAEVWVYLQMGGQHSSMHTGFLLLFFFFF